MSVLLLGPSGVFETEGGATGTMADMLRQSLGRLHPDTAWTCKAQFFYISETMAERVVKVVRQEQPDAVAFLVGSPAFADDFVVYRIRELFPQLFEASLRLSRMIKVIAGGGSEGSGGPRGLVFRLPRRLVAKVLGASPICPLDDAIRLTEQTIDSLVRLEELALVCRGGVANPMYAEAAREHRRRVDVFNRALSVHCQERRVPFYVLQSEMSAAGHPIRFLGDGGHLSRFTREFDMEKAAAHLAASLVS